MPLQMPALKLSRRTGKILAGIALTLLVLAALSAWLVPKAVHRVLTQNVAELLGRPVDVGDIRFNPFTLALSAKDLVIEQRQSAPLLKIGEIDLRVAWRSIVLFAPVLDRIRIDQPQLTLVRQDPTHFNFSDIIERLEKTSAEQPAKPKPASTGVPRFSVNNLSLTGGAISLDDHVTGRRQTITDLTLGIPFISSLSYATKTDVQPAVHMLINGSPFDLTGTARPFDTAPTSTLNVTVDGLALDKWVDFWPPPLPVKIKNALLDSRLQVLFEQPQNAAPRIRVQGDLGLRALDTTESSGAPLMAWDDLKIQGLTADLGARTVSIDTVALEKPRVEAHRDARQSNWQRVAEGFAKLGAPASTKPEGSNPANPATAGSAADAPDSPAAAWKVAIGTFRLNDGEAHLRDDPIKLDYSLKGLDVEVQHIAVPQAANQPMMAQLSMNNPTDGSSLQVQAPIILRPLSVQAQVRLDKLALAPFAAAVRHFAPITLQNGRLSLEGKVTLANSRVEAHNVKLGLAQFAVRDDSVKPGVNLSIGSMALDADRLALDAKPTNFTLRADGIQKHGTLALKGSLTVQPLSLKTSVDLAKFDAASLAPYIASSLNATVRSLSLGARGNAEFTPEQKGKPMQADWRGAVQINDFDLQDRVNKAAFLNWKHLGLTNMHISAEGTRLQLGLGDILLDDFYGNILLNNKARLNVMDIMVDKGKAAGSITQDTQTRRNHAAGHEKPTARHVSAGPDISINSVKLKRGRMTFNDHFVRPNYRAELSSIDGSLTAVSSTKPTPAKVSVAGRVYRTAPFSVSGTVQPFSRYLALDLKASAKGVDLPRFTTYSSKYVGYAIERGKLSVDLRYQIKDRALQASNKVLLNQLTFGKPSGSADAIKLPVLLAVALLKDSSGNIDVNLPISGSLDDPQFSVGGIIVKVIMNTLVKAVTAPFKLLASAFGGGESDLSHIDFAPGSATLDDTAKSNVATLVKALADRPALKMDIIGRADPQADEAGLRQAWVDNQMRAAKARDAGRSKKPDLESIPLTKADRAKYLGKVYDNTKIKDKPRNAIGFAKSIPPEQMNTLLLAAAPVGRQALTKLAEARAQAVYEQITASAEDLADRIFIVAPKTDAASADDGGPATRVDFALH
ncbi:MAG: DUF748 domain-containing protein [Castellaniella sp.]|uniref:DUF748 domain-containing protein n=1 Tax=Castellaniella sp. TaxID=1955812 RepID=UPI001204CBCD|nr:DUF748 domain-containing protein [Castellaniella sp.]TAN30464.1 MAG: DUF748 domain-containing protein [Castellaniella sp.]